MVEGALGATNREGGEGSLPDTLPSSVEGDRPVAQVGDVARRETNFPCTDNSSDRGPVPGCTGWGRRTQTCPPETSTVRTPKGVPRVRLSLGRRLNGTLKPFAEKGVIRSQKSRPLSLVTKGLKKKKICRLRFS